MPHYFLPFSKSRIYLSVTHGSYKVVVESLIIVSSEAMMVFRCGCFSNGDLRWFIIAGSAVAAEDAPASIVNFDATLS